MKITCFQAGQSTFAAKGISRLKVTKSEGGKTSSDFLEIPIKSYDFSQQLAIERCELLPPFIVKDGKETDERDWKNREYLVALREHTDMQTAARIVAGLDVEFKRADGSVVEDAKEKVQVLIGMGLTGAQFRQLLEDITALTYASQKEASDFFLKPLPA